MISNQTKNIEEGLNIGVFFGGRSPEHDVSIITGQFIISELKKMKLNFTPIYLNKDGNWFIGKNLDTLKSFSDNDTNKFSGLDKYYIDIKESHSKIVFKKKGIFGKKINIDIAFPAFHGLNGEDGTIQGLFEIFNVPYVGCDVASSAIAMDKVLTKLFYRSAKMPTADFVYFTRKEWSENKKAILEDINTLGFPIFVKPARLGSSIAITKVSNMNDLENACEVALHYDNKVLAETSVENLSDITCAVVGNEDPKPSLLQESIFKGEHFSYEDKYLDNGGAQLGNAKNNIIIPAEINANITKEIQSMAVDVFKMLGCSGTARVDFLYDKKYQKVYVNEVNTMPGTLYHHLWKKSGIEFNELIDKLLTLAIEKHNEKNKTVSTFDSDILKNANSAKLKITK